MGLYSDLAFMLHRSSESRMKVNVALNAANKQIRRIGEAAFYATLSAPVRHNLCCARILQRDFSQWAGWDFRDQWAQDMRHASSDIPFWCGEPTRHLVVIGEQGIGDEILWASILPEAMVRCEDVTYCTDPRLVAPLTRSLPGLIVKERYVSAEDDLLDGDYTAYIPAADLMPLFRRHVKHFPRKPFMRPDPARLAEMEQYRGRIGLSWAGRHGRIDPLALGLERPLSLQYNEAHPDIETPHIDLRNDIEGVLALCSVLNRVVSVPTSVWHMAASVGTQTDVIMASRESELEEDGVIDELDWHVPLGSSPYYGRSYVFRDVRDWMRTTSRKS